jgi:hypothetical protein
MAQHSVAVSAPSGLLTPFAPLPHLNPPPQALADTIAALSPNMDVANAVSALLCASVPRTLQHRRQGNPALSNYRNRAGKRARPFSMLFQPSPSTPTASMHSDTLLPALTLRPARRCPPTWPR